MVIEVGTGILCFMCKALSNITMCVSIDEIKEHEISNTEVIDKSITQYLLYKLITQAVHFVNLEQIFSIGTLIKLRRYSWNNWDV